MKKVLITGASGFVGGHITRLLAMHGFSVRCLVRATSNIDFIKELKIEILNGDITRPDIMAGALKGADVVVHCAGITKARKREDYYRVNGEACINLYKACKDVGAGRQGIVHIGSLAGLGPSYDGMPVREEDEPRPVSDYGRSKLEGQRAAQSFMKELPIVILLPPAVYGPNDKDFLWYFKFVKRGIMPFIGTKKRHVSVIYVKDIARAVLQVILSGKMYGKTFLLNDGQQYSWEDIGNVISSVMCRKPLSLHIPESSAKAAAFVFEILSCWSGRATLLDRQKINEFLQPSWLCSSEKIKRELGFFAEYSLEKGLKETYGWYREKKWL